MLNKLPKIVLVLIVMMVVFSPFMQLDSWDNFPVATGDIELHLLSVLFETGMFFVFVGILSLFPAWSRSGILVPSFEFAGFNLDSTCLATASSSFIVPLRI